MSSDQLNTYEINGEKIAARSYAAAKMAYYQLRGKASAKPYPHRLERDAELARTQPYYTG